MSKFSLSALTASVSSKEGMTHAILQSIHNQAESTQNDRVRMGNNERGGCWSAEFLNMVGSRDWTLKREKLTEQTISFAKRFYEESLAWLVSEGHAKSIDVKVWESKPTVMSRVATVTLLDGSKFEVEL